MIFRKIFSKFSFIFIITLILNSCIDDYTASPGTYSGTFSYGGGDRIISGEIRFTIERSSFDVLTDFEVSISGCKDLYKYLSAVIPTDRGDGWFTIFDIPVANSEGDLVINCDWNRTDNSDEAKCGIVIFIDDTCGEYGGSAEEYGFIIRRN